MFGKGTENRYQFKSGRGTISIFNCTETLSVSYNRSSENTTVEGLEIVVMALSWLERWLVMTQGGHKGKQEGLLSLQNFKDFSTGS